MGLGGVKLSTSFPSRSSLRRTYAYRGNDGPLEHAAANESLEVPRHYHR